MTPLFAYQGINGFIPGSRASIMLDIVFLAMFAVLPVMAWSIYLVKFRRNYSLHKKLQLLLGGVLLIAVTAFEVDMRFISGWSDRAEPSPYFGTEDSLGWVHFSLWIHLSFAIPTALIWIYTIWSALRNIPDPPRPCPYSTRHVFWGKIAAFEMTMTAITGWIFYWISFVA